MIDQTMRVKPLSVNEAYKGRRFKTDSYKSYEKELLLTLPMSVIVPEGDLVAYYEFGFSSRASDWDNPVKPLQDILQKKYKFNDNRITSAHVSTTYVPKGEEYFSFRFESE